MLKTKTVHLVGGCLHSCPSTTNFSLCLTLTFCTAQLKLRDVLNSKCHKQWPQNRTYTNCKEHVRLGESATRKGKRASGERRKVKEWELDIPSCTLQSFRSAVSLSQDILARLRRRKEASSARYISACTEILWKRGRSRGVHAFAGLFYRSQEVDLHGDVFLYRKLAGKKFLIVCYYALIPWSGWMLDFIIGWRVYINSW